MKEIEKQTEQNYQEFLIERIENDRISSERELKDAETISALSDEISSLKFKVWELEANNKEKEFIELRSEIVRKEAELSNLKKQVALSNNNLRALEEKLGARLSDIKSRFEFHDEILRLKLENERLQEENRSYLLNQAKVQDDLNSWIDELTKKLFVKTEESDEL